jgi:hypothetical protein
MRMKGVMRHVRCVPVARTITGNPSFSLMKQVIGRVTNNSLEYDIDGAVVMFVNVTMS